MAGYGGRSGSGRGGGGRSPSAGRKARDAYKMKQANERFKKSNLPASYAPKYTKNGR